jgi:Predicted protease
VPAANLQAAESWLQGAGLTATPVDGATDYLLASGSAAQVEAAFGTPLNTYTAAGRSFYANTAAPTVPASLAISDVLGLNNFNRLHTPRVQTTGATTTSAGSDERERSEDRPPQHQGSLVDLRRAVHQPGQRPVDGDLRLGRHGPGRS